MMGVGNKAGDARKRQRTSGATEAPAQTTTMDSASAVIEFKVNFEQAMHLAAGKAVHSDAFSAGGYVWRINFFPNGFALMEVGDGSCEELSICLELVSKSRKVKAIFEVLLIDKDYGQPVMLAGLVTRQSRKPYAHSLIWNVSLPDNTDNLIHKYVNDGYIKFLCTIRVLASKPIPVPPSDIVKHLPSPARQRRRGVMTMGVGDEAGDASKRQRTSGPTEAPAQITTMDFASAVVEFKVNYMQAMHLGAAGKAVHSDAIFACGYMWRINFYLSREGFHIYLELLSKSSVKTIFEVLLIDKDYGQPVLVVALSTRQSHKPNGENISYISSPDKIITNNLIHKYVNDGYVKFLCTIRVLPDNPIPVPPSDIVKHLGTLLDTVDGTDVAFTIDGETFHAHRAVLAARSPVFRAELLGSMAEATMTHINLHDITPATFKVMLQFMYTDSLPGDDELGDAPTEMLEHLLAAADRYALDRLKLLCAQKLWDIVSVDTVATTLACAEMYSCLELKKRCIGFFALKKSFKKAVLTEGFVMQRFPSIIVELRDGVEA